MESKRQDAALLAVKQLKAKGVTAIKVELEAQMNRGSSYGEEYCESCDEGRVTCDDCGGNGHNINELDHSIACPNDECSDGTVECEECHGNYHTGSGEAYGHSSVCLDWMLNRIAENTGTVRLDAQNEDDGDESNNSVFDPFYWVKFARFYNDGSVDSELTLTIKLDDERNILHLPAIATAFRELGETIGEGFDVSGAGLHTALIFSEDCTYPHNDDDYSRSNSSSSRRLEKEKLDNFKRSMTQLLPALYFLATTNENSRALRFRMPTVSVDWNYDRQRLNHDAKYSAITYRQGAIEYRIFDTCYDRPEAMLDNIVVIANTMKYMSTEYKSPGIDKKIDRLNFGCDNNDKVDRFYATQTHLETLNMGIARLKPSYYTVREIKRQRKFSRTMRSINKLKQEREKQATVEFKEYEERFKWQLVWQEATVKASQLERYIRQNTPESLRGMTEEKLDAAIAEAVETDMKYYRGQYRNAEKYISERITRLESDSQGQYTLQFS